MPGKYQDPRLRFFKYFVHKVIPIQNAYVQKGENQIKKTYKIGIKFISSSTPWSNPVSEISES